MARSEQKDRRGPAPPKAALISERLHQLEAMARQLDREYAQLYEWAYSVGLPTPEFGRGKPKSSVSDPTGETMTAAAKQRSRGAAVVASEKILDAMAKIRAAHDALVQSLPDPERLTPMAEIYPRTVREHEIVEAREAQERRRERGEL